jgi:membrane-bound lytic murein transglycosylase D
MKSVTGGARKFLVASCVLTAGLVLGFGVPRPGWAARWIARLSPAPKTQPVEQSAPNDNEAAFAQLAAMDRAARANAGGAGSESSELAQLRAAEDAMFPDVPQDARVTRARGAAQHKVCGIGDDVTSCRADEPPPSDPGATADADWMVGLRMPEIPVRADSRVERFVRYFTQNAQGRKMFRAWLKRSGRYRAVVATGLRDRFLPQDLHALVMVESGYSPTATSSAGATGLWQLMPETARVYGLAVEEDYDERRDPDKSTGAATRLLADLYTKFGSWELALAAYDMGYKGLVGRVRNLSSNDFWTMADIEGALPREAVLYVPKVLAAALILKNLDRYGFDDTHYDGPFAEADLDVPAGVDLATVARASASSLQFIRQLNPAMLSDYVPDRGQKFDVHIPDTGAMRANQLLASLLDRRVRDGLEDDAPADFDWGREDVPPDGSHRGGRRARSHGGQYEPFGGADDGRTASRDDVDDDGPGRGSRAEADDIGVDRQTIYYRVGENETINSIARAFGARADDMIDDNHLDPAARLQRGMVLKLRVPAAAASRIARRRASARLEDQEEAAARDPGGNGDPSADPPSSRRHASDGTALSTDTTDAFALALGEARHRHQGVVMLNRHHGASQPARKRHERSDDP